MGIQLSAEVENIVGKGEICSLRAISPFPTMFSKAVRCFKMSIFGVKDLKKPTCFQNTYLDQLAFGQKSLCHGVSFVSVS